MNENKAIGGLPLVLGGNVFGWTAKGEDGFAVLDAFYESGGRMIDTSDSYSQFVPGHKGGESETLLGEWLASRGVRKDMKIHTKTGNLPGDNVLEPDRVTAAMERSLNRLQTDYVDLYYVHFDNEDVPTEQIVRAFDAMVRVGKARKIGTSNTKLARLKAAIEFARESGLTAFSALQNQFNLLERKDFGPEYQQYCTENRIAMFPYFGLASGYLTGKYRAPEDFEKWVRGRRTMGYAETGPKMLAIMDEIATETGASLPAIALSWLASQPGITAPIASARTTEQLAALIESTKLNLSETQLNRLSNAH